MFTERLTENETKRIVTAFALQEARTCCPQMEDGLCCSPSGECEHPDIKSECFALPVERLYSIAPAQLPR